MRHRTTIDATVHCDTKTETMSETRWVLTCHLEDLSDSRGSSCPQHSHLYELCHARELHPEPQRSSLLTDEAHIEISLATGYQSTFTVMITRKRMHDQPTYHAAASWVHEHRHSFSEVGDFKEHHIGCDEVHGECSSLREAHVIWDLVDKFHWRADHLCPGVVVDKCHDTVPDLGMGRHRVNGSFLLFFERFLKSSWEPSGNYRFLPRKTKNKNQNQPNPPVCASSPASQFRGIHGCSEAHLWKLARGHGSQVLYPSSQA